VADAAEFIVALVDKVSGPARKAAAQIDALRKKFMQAGEAATRARKQQEDAWRAMGRMQDKAGRWREANGRFVTDKRKGGGVLGGLGLPSFEGAGKWAGGKADEFVKWTSDKVVSAAKFAFLATSAAAGAAGAAIVKNTLHMANFAETTMMAFHALTGSQSGADQAWQRSLALSKQLGMGVEEVAGSMKHLLAMQFSLGEAEEMVKISADLTAVTGDAHAAERALRAITQIKAKGRLQSEELVGQLAEAGVSTTLVYEELGKLYGKDTNAIRKLITAGAVDADTGIKAIKAAILRKTHSTEAGTAGTSFAQSTFTGLMGQLKNAPQFLFVRLAEQVKANLDKFRPAVQKIIDAIDNIRGDQMARFVGNVLQFAERLVPLALAFAEGFGEGFSAINEAMGAVNPAVASLDTARNVGKAVAKAFEIVFDILGKIAAGVGWLEQHDMLGATLASALGILAAMRAVVAISGTAAALKSLAGLLPAAVPAAVPALAPAAVPVATTAAGTTGLAALAGGLGAGGAGALMGGGLIAAGLGYYFREEIAKWMYGDAENQTHERGIGLPAPTPLLTGMQRSANSPSRTNNVRMESNIVINGAEKDGQQLGREIQEHQRGQLEQFFQSQALEQGAM
jgi:tape measure domain-containing protein